MSDTRSLRFLLPLVVLLMFQVALVGLPATNLPATSERPSLFTVLKAYGQAQQPAAKSFLVMITDNGFNNGSLHITVSQGDSVTINFTMDQSQRSNTDPSNHHNFLVTGYGVTTAEINSSHPSTTVTFTAEKVGTFSIICGLPDCPIHYLLLTGVLEVDAPASTASSSSTASTTSTTTTATAAASTSSTSTISSVQSAPSTSSSQALLASTNATGSTQEPSAGTALTPWLETVGAIAVVAFVAAMWAVLRLEKPSAK